jgi:DNA-binding transcriptional ArsR family regulator
MPDIFDVIADGTRREILHILRAHGGSGGSGTSVSQIVHELGVSQPTVSKHLKVLREAGFVSCRGEAQQRIYQLEPAPFHQLAAWLTPYARLWNRHLDALASFLDTMEKTDASQPVSSRRPRRRRRRS